MTFETPETIFRNGDSGEENAAEDLLNTAREALSGVRPHGSKLDLAGD